MYIVISGAHGLLGSEVGKLLSQRGDKVVALVRKNAASNEIAWRPTEGTIDGELSGVDAVIHLAGESIASGRWTDSKKKEIRDSRLKSTTLLANTLAHLEKKPSVFLCASAIGFYGDRGAEDLCEDSAGGTGFLAELCQDWESATESAQKAGIRVVNLRIGIVLSPDGGALQQMLLPFQMGLGGNIGDGRQYMSWIAIDDLARSIIFCLDNDTLSGAVNLVSPNPVTNSRFTKALGKAISRPTLFPMPSFAAKLALGEMAEELLLSGAKVHPKKLQAAGFRFNHTAIEDVLKHILNK